MLQNDYNIRDCKLFLYVIPDHWEAFQIQQSFYILIPGLKKSIVYLFEGELIFKAIFSINASQPKKSFIYVYKLKFNSLVSE